MRTLKQESQKGGSGIDGRLLSHRLAPMCLSIALCVLGGCATITKGSNQTVTVNTDPSGANCVLSREGQTLAVINPTPGSISVKKDNDNIAVVCKLRGYQDSAGTFQSEFTQMTWGNIVFGGLIGAAVDSGSGAMHHYQPMVTITMIPEQFGSISERDAFFNKMTADFLRNSAESIRLISEKCNPDTCESEMNAAQAAQQARLYEIEKERQLAKVYGVSSAQLGRVGANQTPSVQWNEGSSAITLSSDVASERKTTSGSTISSTSKVNTAEQISPTEKAGINEEANPTAAEIIFWEDVRDSKDPEMLELYLEQYPSGEFSKLAKLKLRRLESHNTLVTTAAPSIVSDHQSNQLLGRWKAVYGGADERGGDFDFGYSSIRWSEL